MSSSPLPIIEKASISPWTLEGANNEFSGFQNNSVKDECSYEGHKFEFSRARKKKQKKTGNEKPFIATVFEFVYVITSL